MNAEINLQIDAKLLFFFTFYFFYGKVEVGEGMREINCPSSRQKLFAYIWTFELVSVIYIFESCK